ncbi:hypothetical protein TNCV_4106951 [Trichonephila clavipes]|nr:hypothetical protein TNCV_4106951 [Trichonephila clavipes]
MAIAKSPPVAEECDVNIHSLIQVHSATTRRKEQMSRLTHKELVQGEGRTSMDQRAYFFLKKCLISRRSATALHAARTNQTLASGVRERDHILVDATIALFVKNVRIFIKISGILTNWSALKIGVETSQIVQSPVWCSKLRLTTGVTWPFAMINFVDLDVAFADQVASVTTTTETSSRRCGVLVRRGGASSGVVHVT